MVWKWLFSCGLALCVFDASAQRFLTDVMDSSTAIGRQSHTLFSKYDRLRFGGYMQPQFQWAEEKGADSYNGGDFSAESNNRFMLRRGRIRLDYFHFNEAGKPLTYFAFQFDGTERGVAIRDFWGRFFENKWELFAVTTGVFARPMGFELSYSSVDRESPERGRMSQILMRTERDLGAMLTIENRKRNTLLKNFRADIGLFNGQGLTGPGDYDSYKDLIARVSLRPTTIKSLGWILSANASMLYGGIGNRLPQVFDMQQGAVSAFRLDSSAGHVNRKLPRHYFDLDFQLKIPDRKYGFTEFRAEVLWGRQTATALTTETPGIYPVDGAGNLQPLYVRPFIGGYVYFLQHLFSDNLQLVLKYDWYDPNRWVSGRNLRSDRGFSAADVRYDTYAGGFVYHFNPHMKATLWYEHVRNEATSLPGYTQDRLDNVFTFRMQYRF